MAEKKDDVLSVRLPSGSFKKIDRVLRGGEIRAAFIRFAVEAELKRRSNLAVAKTSPAVSKQR